MGAIPRTTAVLLYNTMTTPGLGCFVSSRTIDRGNGLWSHNKTGVCRERLRKEGDVQGRVTLGDTP